MYRKLLSLLMFLFCVTPLLAQSSDTDLIAYFNDQLYVLDNNALVPYDSCTPDEEIVGQFIPLADGTGFLITTFPQIVSEALELFGSLGEAPYSPNLWLCDTTTNSLERIIAQPGGDAPFEGELPPIEAVMGEVVLSPDGRKLAWTELSFEDDSQSVVTFDLVTGETSAFLMDVPLAPFPAPPEVIAWTDSGLLLWMFVFDEITFFNIETLLVVDMEAETLVGEYEILNGGESDDFYNKRELVVMDDDIFYAIEFENEGWLLVDINTGDLIPASGRLALTVPDSEASIELQYEIDFEFNYVWEYALPDGEISVLRAYPPQRIALSPDGTEVAYADSTLHIADASGNVTEIANSDGFADDFAARLIWGNATLTFIELDEIELAPPAFCEGAPPIQVAEGDTARVIAPTVPNRIRSLPTTDGAILGEIPGGGEFIVRGGPECAQGYTWFQIEYNGIIGWTVEGRGDNYFIEPVSDLP